MLKYRVIEDIKHGEILIGKPGESYIVFRHKSPIENKSIFGDSYKCPFCGKELLYIELVKEAHPEYPEKGIGRATWTTRDYKCECGYHSF